MNLNDTTPGNPPSQGTQAPLPVKAAGGLSVEVVSAPEDLKAYQTDWQDLAAAAAEPNPFYEPWMLLPALRHLAAGKTLLPLFVFAADPARPGGRLLTGFFPLECELGYRGLPVRVTRLWKHLHCFLTTPLLRAGHRRATLDAFFGWLASDARAGALMEFPLIGADGPCQQALLDHLHVSRRPHLVTEGYTRPVLRPAADAEAHLSAALSGRHRKNLRRRERQLAELGRVEYAELAPDGDADAWIEDFLRLEASGWKGRQGSALVSDAVQREYFREIASQAFRRGQLGMLSLKLDGRTIASKCDFLSGRVAFNFKIAFDEDYARFSPGVLLDLHNLRRFHAQSQIAWEDSCTVPGPAAISSEFDRLWPERRIVQSLLVSTGRGAGDFILSLLPLLAWLRHRLPGRRPQAAPAPPEDPQ